MNGIIAISRAIGDWEYKNLQFKPEEHMGLPHELVSCRLCLRTKSKIIEESCQRSSRFELSSEAEQQDTSCRSTLSA